MAARPRPPRPAGPAALLLWPGAGADRDHHTLVALEQALAPRSVERCDFPNRRAGKRGPERAPVAMADIRERAAEVAARLGVGTEQLVLGGRSFGGRMCSMVVAEGLPVAGLVLLSYPLHPPGRPERLRTEHLGALAVPCLFVTGTRDPFGAPEELEAATASIPGVVTHRWVPGAHDPRGQDDAIATAVAGWLDGLRVG